MQAAPQVIILAIVAAEEGAEIVKLDPPQGRRGAAFADRARVVGRNPVDPHRVVFVQPLAPGQRQGRHIIEGKAEIGQQHPPLEVLGHIVERRDQEFLGGKIGGGEQAFGGEEIEHRARSSHRIGSEHGEARVMQHALVRAVIERKNAVEAVPRPVERIVGNVGIKLPVA